MTEKLYYKDAYIKEFEAVVLSVTERDGAFDVLLDRTAFFPEEGGQSADRGYIGNCRVINAYEREGTVYHVTDVAPELGNVQCTIDFDERYVKMQCHTAEHILCGIIHRLYGLDNVGFHLGEDCVTFDISAPLSRDQIDRVEELANEAVYQNICVTASFPSASELQNIEYRSKLELTDNVRIVRIGEVDCCACCAPHVDRTGEIGIIKILDIMKHRGGLRIWMVAGRLALEDYRKRYFNTLNISGLLSAPQHNTAEVLTEYMKETEQLKYRLRVAGNRLAEALASCVEMTDGNLVRHIPDVGIDELRSFAKLALPRVSGILVALSGEEGDYKYVLGSNSVDLRASAKAINSALCGRGGGRPCMIQGSFSATLEKIKEYFK